MVADALSRQSDPFLAARSDPWVLDRQLREFIAEHERLLSGRPPDRQHALATACDELQSARGTLALRDAAVTRDKADLEDLGRFAGLSRHSRERRGVITDRLQDDRRRAAAARDRHDEIADQVARLQQEQDAHLRFETSEGWRRDDIARRHAQLDDHWAAVAAVCVSADDPLAYGIDKLRHARSTLTANRRAIDAGIPDDRAEKWQQARRQLPEVVRQRHQAEELLAAGQARLKDAGRRRWGRYDHQAIADVQAKVAAGERRVHRAVADERDLRERLGALAEHQQRRQQHIAEISAQRKQLDSTLAQIDAALDRTRADRVGALADDPPEHLVHRIGPAPDTPQEGPCGAITPSTSKPPSIDTTAA